MPQLNFYAPQELADKIRTAAERESLSVSKYLANLVKDNLERQLPWQLESSFGGWREAWPEVTDEIPEPIEPL